MATEHAHQHQQLATGHISRGFSGEKSFGRWRHLVGGLAGPGTRRALIKSGAMTERQVLTRWRAATLPGKLVAFKICNRQLVIGVIEWTLMGRKPVGMASNSIAMPLRLTLSVTLIRTIYINH